MGFFLAFLQRPKRKAPSDLPAVQVPHPGASYNPDYEDYQVIFQSLQLFVRKFLSEYFDRVNFISFNFCNILRKDCSLFCQELLSKAHEVEEKKLIEEKKLQKFEEEIKKVDPKTLEVCGFLFFFNEMPSCDIVKLSTLKTRSQW